MTSTRTGIPRCRTHRRTMAADNFTMETYYYGRRSILTGRPSRYWCSILHWPLTLTYDLGFQSQASKSWPIHTYTIYSHRSVGLQEILETNGRTNGQMDKTGRFTANMVDKNAIRISQWLKIHPESFTPFAIGAKTLQRRRKCRTKCSK